MTIFSNILMFTCLAYFSKTIDFSKDVTLPVVLLLYLQPSRAQHLVGTQKYLLIEWVNKHGKIPFFSTRFYIKFSAFLVFFLF